MTKPPGGEDGPRTPRPLTADEKELWFSHTREDIRMMESRRVTSDPPKKPPPRKVRTTHAALHVLPFQSDALAPLAHGDVTGLDGRQARRFKQGQIAPEATLDLHGYTLANGHAAVERFITDAYLSHKRMVLIVTGRGRTREEEARPGEVGHSTLRAQVPQWLNQPPLRGLIVAFDHARQQDGGFGALYVYLRRKDRP